MEKKKLILVKEYWIEFYSTILVKGITAASAQITGDALQWAT